MPELKDELFVMLSVVGRDSKAIGFGLTGGGAFLSASGLGLTGGGGVFFTSCGFITGRVTGLCEGTTGFGLFKDATGFAATSGFLAGTIGFEPDGIGGLGLPPTCFNLTLASSEVTSNTGLDGTFGLSLGLVSSTAVSPEMVTSETSNSGSS